MNIKFVSILSKVKVLFLINTRIDSNADETKRNKQPTIITDNIFSTIEYCNNSDKYLKIKRIITIHLPIIYYPKSSSLTFIRLIVNSNCKIINSQINKIDHKYDWYNTKT